MNENKKIKRTFLITGAAHRIGKALVEGLAYQANAICIHYGKSKEAAQELSNRLLKMDIKVALLSANLESQEEASGLMERAWKAVGPIDVLINNASIFEESRLDDITVEEMNRNLMLNAYSPMLLARSFAKLNNGRKTGALPVIINFLDCRITSVDRAHFAYHLAKRTLFTFTKTMALEFAPQIRVNAVAPGLILPPKGKDTDYLEKLKSTNPLNAVGNADYIVDAVDFLINNEYVTGQVIYVDGGQNLLTNNFGL